MDACDKSWKETLQVHLHAEVEICGTARCTSDLYICSFTGYLLLSCSGNFNSCKKNPAAQPSFSPQTGILPDRGRSMLELLPPCGHMREKQQVQHYNSFLLLLMCLLTATLVPYLQRIT